jgi:hypothetical protein
VWTIAVEGGSCEVQTFASGHTWTSDRFGDAGTYTGGFHGLTEHFTTGNDVGAVFKATWSKARHDYKGTYMDASARTFPATLIKGATC